MGQVRKKDEKELDKILKVHWVADTPGGSVPASSTSSLASSPSLPRSQLFVDPLYLYFFVLFVLVRTPNRRDKVKRFLRALTIDVPRQAVQGLRALALRLLVGKERAHSLVKELSSKSN